MNIFVFGIIIFVLVYIFLSWFAKTSSKKIAQFLRRLAVLLSVLLAAVLAIGGKYLFSLPFLIILLSALKIKGLTALQMFQLWRLIQHLRSKNQSGPSSQGSTNISVEESFRLLGLKKGCTKSDVLKAAAKLQKKIHPDMNRDMNTERLSQLVNEAKEKILKADFK